MPKVPRDANEPNPTRVWQACVACRRKKIKCDGNTPCRNCESREASCDYQGSNDNASNSRNFGMMIEARCQQLNSFCERLEGLASQLTTALETLQKVNGASPSSTTNDLPRSLHHQPQATPTIYVADDILRAIDSQPEFTGHADDDGNMSKEDDEDETEDDEIDERDQGNDAAAFNQATVGRLGSLVTDSYGRLRFLGGATNNMLVEAVQSITPGQSLASDSPLTTKTADGNIPKNTIQPNEIPIFIHGQQWRSIPLLPAPQDLGLPPWYVADMLVGLYFDQFHYTFPVIYKPQFMAQFKQLKSANKTDNPKNERFLSVFFAVCACSASLIPSNSSSTSFSGLEYYEKALLVHFSLVGEASLERVQCLALLSMCCAGWNTLSTSWNFAGQAVRAAQDLGLHLSGLTQGIDTSCKSSPSFALRREISQRVWWSVYCLDRVTSICLGRPLAAQDADCHCKMPLAVADDELQHASENPESLKDRSASNLPLSGFLAFARLCRISGRIQRLHSPSRLSSLTDPKKAALMEQNVAAIDTSLSEWLDSLPDEIRFSPNHVDRGPNLTLCVIMFIAHSGLLLNLYRTISADPNIISADKDPISQCIGAARSCINASELVREVVPPSHHLAFCIHYLTISGLVLIRTQDQAVAKNDPDLRKCIQFLKDLEPTWSGASRARKIIEQLLETSSKPSADPIALWGAYEGSTILQLAGTDGLDLDMYTNMDFPSSWNWFPT
ncbi:fungal-specific transcription factor domain-containing protein [Stachybotrys elegans]|uniref:Fungal-specific transcription factor domain-containing protein n=1 Tax=Stachybotrys elegans TaxID=80388 RepID=A0A8K0WUA7_9HYPO|nr:fungal-specific transcription factor domain-containing protein [Stachybotrys elegans]